MPLNRWHTSSHKISQIDDRQPGIDVRAYLGAASRSTRRRQSTGDARTTGEASGGGIRRPSVQASSCKRRSHNSLALAACSITSSGDRSWFRGDLVGPTVQDGSTEFVRFARARAECSNGRRCRLAWLSWVSSLLVLACANKNDGT